MCWSVFLGRGFDVIGNYIRLFFWLSYKYYPWLVTQTTRRQCAYRQVFTTVRIIPINAASHDPPWR